MPTRLTFHLIPHTHWDREWYLTHAAFQARLVAAMDALTRLLDTDPNARFVLDGQTVLVEDALEVRPEWTDQLARASTDGRLDVGPWYVLADEQIPSGESLLRNLLEGASDTASLGRRMHVLYSPDAFGHPGVLPALAAQFGISTGVAWRGLAPDKGADRDLYRWRSPDGSEMLLYHLPPSGYEIGSDLLGPGRGLAARWRAIRNALVTRAAGRHIAVFVGADHHAPPPALTPLLRRIQALEASHHVKLSTLTEYFDVAGTGLRASPSITGELRASYGHTWTLQGVHATRTRMKRRHARAELALVRNADVLATLAGTAGFSDRRGLLKLAWRTLIQCQFHDTLCGCSSDDVAAQQDVRLGSVEALSAEIVRGAVHELTHHDADAARTDPTLGRPTLLLWNPASRRRNGITVAEMTCFRRDVMVGPPTGRMPRTAAGFAPFDLVDAAGNVIPVQVIGVRPGLERVDAARHYPDQDEVDRVWIAFDAPETGGLSLNTLAPRPVSTRPRARGLVTSKGFIANRFVELGVSPTGGLRLTDKRTGERFSNLLRLEDDSDMGDSYSVFVPPGSPRVNSGTPISRTVLADGPLFGAVETRWSMKSAGRGPMTFRLVVMLHADSPIVRLRLEIENRATDHRLRAHFPVRAGTDAVAGAAFGYERRPPVVIVPGEFPAETPVKTSPAQRFVAAGEGTRGLALFAPGFFEYEWTKKQELIFTMFRSVGELSRPNLPTRRGHAGWPMPVPGAQESGLHVVELAMATTDEDDMGRVDRLERMWEDAFLPLHGMFTREYTGSTGTPNGMGISLEGSGLVFTACKPALSGGGLVLRCYNSSEQVSQGRWVFAAPISGATMLWADEREMGALRLRNPRRVEFTAGPRQIVTLMVIR